MNKKSLLIVAMAFICIATSAQTYDQVYRRNSWNDGKGVVGIRQDSVNVSIAEATGSYETGNYRSSSQAGTAWTAGARAASIKHLKTFSMAGSFRYEQFWGQEMAGSMFVRPGYFPIEVYEFTPGEKIRQTYSMNGAISVDVSPEWRIGAGTDFTSANLAKRKDLRHTTYMLDFSVIPGIQYHSGDFAIGLNYVFAKTTETITAEQIGSKVASYDVFFDKGLYYGNEEIWTGSGVHLSEQGVSGLPVVQTSQGLSLQASGDNVYAGVSWRNHSGFSGEKQRVWYRFDGNELAADVVASFPVTTGSHRLKSSMTFFRQTNNETVLERINEGGVSTTIEHGANQVFLRSRLSASLAYDFNARGWGAGANIVYHQNEGMESGMYPYVASQVLKKPSVEIHGTKAAGAFDLRMSATLSNGIMYDDLLTVASDSGVAGIPERLERYFVKYREHMTHNAVYLAPSVRFNFRRQYYVEAAALWQHGFKMEYLGNNRINATLRFGYNF